MFYPESKKEAVKLAQGAVEKMGALEITPNPQNYTIWYAYPRRFTAVLHPIPVVKSSDGGFGVKTGRDWQVSLTAENSH